MMKYIYTILIGITILFYSSCNDSLEVSGQEIIPIDTVDVLTGKDYYLTIVIDDTSLSFRSSRVNQGTGVYKQVLGTCISGNDSMQFVTYFSRVADTNHNEIVSFGLINCIEANANGYRDSTYVEGVYPIGDLVDTTTNVKAFFEYIDSDSVLWSTTLTTKGYGAQKNHPFNLTKVTTNYQIDSIFEIEGDFTGWIYNGIGDSMLVSRAVFYSKAWAI